jgi:hypothetical protein
MPTRQAMLKKNDDGAFGDDFSEGIFHFGGLEGFKVM